MLQGDGGFNCNCTTPRNVSATLMIMIILRLENVTSLGNSGGNSMFNPVERLISSLNLALQAMDCDRLQSSKKSRNSSLKVLKKM